VDKPDRAGTPDGHSQAAPFERTQMRGGIDPFRHPRDHCDPGPGQIISELVSKPATGFRRVARAHYPDHFVIRPARLAYPKKEWRTVIDMHQQRG